MNFKVSKFYYLEKYELLKSECEHCFKYDFIITFACN